MTISSRYILDSKTCKKQIYIHLVKKLYPNASQDIETEKPSQLTRKENFKFEYKYFKNLINAYHITFLKSRSFHFLKN